jgi:hypothetical protein
MWQLHLVQDTTPAVGGVVGFGGVISSRRLRDGSGDMPSIEKRAGTSPPKSTTPPRSGKKCAGGCPFKSFACRGAPTAPARTGRFCSQNR